MELHLGNVEHFKECSLNHIFCQFCHEIFSREKKNQIQIYCLKLDGGEQESETITVYNTAEQDDEKTSVQSSDLFLLAMGYLSTTFLKNTKCHPGDIIIFQWEVKIIKN